jgi:hypothetical protein
MAAVPLSGASKWLCDEKVRAVLLGRYIDTLAETARLLHLGAEDFGYSERELRGAFEEAELDVVALWKRRRPERNGLSVGKIAGVLAYRLSRFKIVYFSERAAERRNAFIVQDLTALTFVCEQILHRAPPNRSLCELAYQLSRRHANQETLALFFDLYAEGLPRA